MPVLRQSLPAWLIRLAMGARISRRFAARTVYSGIEGAARELGSSVGHLQEASRLLESLFSGLQSTLERLAVNSAELVDRGQLTVRMACGQETGRADFNRTISVLESPLAYLTSAYEDMRRVAEDLREATEALDRLLATERGLESAIAPLRFTQAMFSIESATLAEESRLVFSNLTRGIAQLNERVQVSFGEHFETLSETHACLRQTVETLDRQSQHQMRELRSKHEQINRSLAQLSEEVAHNRDRDVRLTKASADLANQVNRAVVGLQTQDIVSQKLSHAREGLEDALRAVELSKDGGMDALERLPTLARIEAAQIDAVTRELDRGGDVLRRAVQGIGHELDQLDSECLMLGEFKEITASVNGTIQVLLDILSDVRELVDATRLMAARTTEMIRPVSAAAASLTSTVEGVAHEMRLIALNAQIQAIQIGRGTGLEVLAAHTAEVSRSITELGAEITRDLAGTAGRVQSNIDRLTKVRERGEAELAALDTRGGNEEASLHEFRDQMLAEVLRIGELLEQARRDGQGMLERIDLGPVEERISAVRERVAKLIEASETIETRSSRANCSGHAASLQSRYTTASERVVHRDTLEELGHRDEAVESISPGGQESSPGVEFF